MPVLPLAVAVILLVSGCASWPSDSAAPTNSRPATAPTTVPVPVTSTTWPPPPDPPPLTWSDCGTGLQCATLPVPVDWADPGGPSLDLALARRPAPDPHARLGSVLFNPGGPGASGLDQLRAGPPVDDEAADRFDLVSWDPRGVGDSAPLACDDLADPWSGTDAAPDDDTERDAIEQRAEVLADDCAERDGALLPHLGTNQTIRDLDQIRRALGDDQLNFVGSSYGTYIGQLYAEAYPDHVRAMVLDGVVDPALDLADLSTGQAIAFEEQLTRILDSCTRACPADPHRTYDELADRVERDQVPSRDGTPLDSGALTQATVVAAYSPTLWATFLRGLTEAGEGDATILTRLAGTFTELAATAPYLAVLCADWETVEDPAGFADLAATLALDAPRLGDTFGYEYLPCAYWPDTTWRAAAPVTAPNAPPVLLVATTGDPATPLDQARSVERALERATLVTVAGFGHGALGGNDCLDAIVSRYLVDLELPPDDTTC